MKSIGVLKEKKAVLEGDMWEATDGVKKVSGNLTSMAVKYLNSQSQKTIVAFSSIYCLYVRVSKSSPPPVQGIPYIQTFSTSSVGEAFRPLVWRTLVNAGYAVSLKAWCSASLSGTRHGPPHAEAFG